MGERRGPRAGEQPELSFRFETPAVRRSRRQPEPRFFTGVTRKFICIVMYSRIGYELPIRRWRSRSRSGAIEVSSVTVLPFQIQPSALSANHQNERSPSAMVIAFKKGPA